jgi:hypothetical protein
MDFQATNMQEHEDLYNPSETMSLRQANQALALLDDHDHIIETNVYSDVPERYIIQAHLRDGRHKPYSSYVTLGSFQSVKTLLERIS